MAKSYPGSWSTTSRWKFSIIIYFVFFVDILVDPCEILTSGTQIFKTAQILQKSCLESYLFRGKTLISLIDHHAKFSELWTRANIKIKRAPDLKFGGNAPLGV